MIDSFKIIASLVGSGVFFSVALGLLSASVDVQDFKRFWWIPVLGMITAVIGSAAFVVGSTGVKEGNMAGYYIVDVNGVEYATRQLEPDGSFYTLEGVHVAPPRDMLYVKKEPVGYLHKGK